MSYLILNAELEKTLHAHLLCFLRRFLCVSDVTYSSFLAPASFWDGQESLQELVMSTWCLRQKKSTLVSDVEILS